MNARECKTQALYFPGYSKGLFEYLSSITNPDIQFHLFVDNDDHEVSSEFYQLRKVIRAGKKIGVHIHPKAGTPEDVFEFMKEKLKLSFDVLIFESKIETND